ncbi:MAG: hypothetical protein ACKOAR_08940 [Bacteroidota bacterium]
MLVDPNAGQTVARENLLYKCGWSPFEGYRFRTAITHTLVSGKLVWENGSLKEEGPGMRLTFRRD